MKKIIGLCLLLTATTAYAGPQEKVEIQCEKVIQDDIYNGTMTVNESGTGSMYMTVNNYQPNPAQDEGLAGRQNFKTVDGSGSERDIYFDHRYELSDPVKTREGQEIDFTSVIATQNIDGTFKVVVTGPAVKAIQGRNRMIFPHCWSVE